MATRFRSKLFSVYGVMSALAGGWLAATVMTAPRVSAVTPDAVRSTAADGMIPGHPHAFGAQGTSVPDSAREGLGATSTGCLGCHTGAEDPHPTKQNITCVDCHGGDGTATDKTKAHPKPNYPDKWKTAANPHASYTLLNAESHEWIRFMNPSDLRVAPEVCGRCHNGIVNSVAKGSMVNSAQVYSTALYNNASVPFKDALFAENYTPRGEPQIIKTLPPPTADDTRLHGILPQLVPFPRFEIGQPGNIFRVFERGGGPKSELGNPNRDDVPGQPDVTVTNRGFGTQASVDPVILGAQKTRLNDPVLSFLGTNDSPGDYRNSGCAACHVIYANDRDTFNAGPYAQFGNLGRTVNPDPTIPKNESGHPIKHEFTRKIPSSQCITCHVHNGNGFLNTYLGEMWWDEETDGEHLYPKAQHNPTIQEVDRDGRFNPEEAASRGLWNDPKFLENVSEMNPQLKQAQFSDYHGHGWMFQKVFKRDRKGNFLDVDGRIIQFDDPQLWQKAVHLKDIHLEKVMQCVDCHFTQDVHGTGKIYGDRRAAIEIQCKDCHGTTTEPATLVTSGPAAAEGGRDLSVARVTPFNVPQFQKRGGRIVQRSMVVEGLQWDVPQVADTIDPASPIYNQKARLAHTIQRDGVTWGDGKSPNIAHPDSQVTCYMCHTSWTTNCFGCHLAAKVNTKKPLIHNEYDLDTQVYASYNPEILRSDGFLLGIDGTVEGHKVAPARSSSAFTLSVQNAARDWVVNQAQTVSSAGYTGNAFNTHPPHTVRAKETKQCDDCHVSKNGDNNAWMSSILMLGTNQVNFMSRYIYVARGGGGLSAVAVTEREEPQAVYGSHLHKIAYPDDYAAYVKGGQELKEAVHHGGDVKQAQMYGEYVLTAGSHGFQVFDVANVGNKDFAQPIVTAPFKNQQMKVSTKNATGLAVGSPAPLDLKRVQLPINEEQPIAPLFGYAYVSDSVEGLIVIDVKTLPDGIPTNNHLERNATFNPGGELNGASSIVVAGNYAYITATSGLKIVDISDPIHPKMAASLGAPLNQPRHVAVQFRYAFVTDADGLKVVDITNPRSPRAVSGAAVPIAQANGIYVARTYAYVAAGSQGLAIVDIERPEHPQLDQTFNAGGKINDARDVKLGMTNVSLFAYVADGKNGLQVVELSAPDSVPGNLGFSPKPNPRLVGHYAGAGGAVGISEGYRRDRAVDESGNQIAVFGRRGARPFNLEEQQKMFLKSGQLWTVTNDPPAPAR
jgi:hypothetical protein